MKFINQKLPGLFLIIPQLHEDERGVFRRSFCNSEFSKQGIEFEVKQGNISNNFKKHTLRGFHYQKLPSKESKVISCVTGSLYNIVLDLRQDSKTFHQWQALSISDKNNKQKTGSDEKLLRDF